MSDPQWSSWITEVRARLGSPAGQRLPASDGRQAAVLVALYVDAGELWTLLTRRSEELPDHQGRIAFPGGGLASGEQPWDAALRGAHEETGLEPGAVLRLGTLDEIETASGDRIVPCVGAVPSPVSTSSDGGEVEEVFPVPISVFANPRAIEERVVSIGGSHRTIRVYHVGSRSVGGLAAVILQYLLERLGLAPVEEPPN